MADEDRTADRTAIKDGFEALQRATEEISNLTLEEHQDARERIVSLLNTVGEKFGDIGDRIAADEKVDADGVDESGRVVAQPEASREDVAKRETPADVRKNRR